MRRRTRTGLLLVLALLPLVVGGCGGGAQEAKTVTVERQVTVAQPPAASHHHRHTAATSTASTRASTNAFVDCDSHIQAKVATTTCPFAENVFWTYWTSGESSSAFQVWSPPAQASFATTCNSSGVQILCTTDDNAAIKFSQSAVDRYSQSQADAYASAHDLGPDPSEGVPDTGSAPDSGGGGGGGDCQGYDPCIPPGGDVDCAGGSGDGPRYVEGPVYVTGSDPYGLDRDGDGVGCDQ